MALNKKFTRAKLLVIIITTVFSFSSMSDAFFLKSYSAIPWFILCAVVYFFPYCIILSDLTSVYQNEKGGVYSWLKETNTEKVAFIATFLWYGSYFTWMISLVMKTWIPLSILIFGKDLTSSKQHLLNFSAIQWVGILSILLIIGMTLATFRGFRNISFFSVMSGRFMLFLVSVMFVGSLLLFIGHHGKLAEPFHVNDLFKSQGQFQTPIENLSFLLFGITAFGGLDTVSSLVNNTGELKRNFGKYLLVSGIVILSLYILGIVFWGAGINVQEFIHGPYHLGNLMYGLMGQLSLNIANLLGLSTSAAALLSIVFMRLTALTLFTAYISLLSILFFVPIRSLLESIRGMKGDDTTEESQKVQLKKALGLQALFIALFVFILSFQNQWAATLYNKLTIMTNISRSIPYLLVALSYPKFKQLYPTHPYLSFVNNKKVTYLLSGLVALAVFLGIIFSVYQKISVKQFVDASWLVSGPLLFAIVGYIFYKMIVKNPNKIA
ncbi:amino acid permease [Enterococcus bulliens]